MKSCCIAGHQNIPHDKIEHIKARLREEIEAAVKDGYVHFISTFDEGPALYGAEIVSELIVEGKELALCAALCTEARKVELLANPKTMNLLLSCKYFGIHSNEADETLTRNRFIANRAQRIIAVYLPEDNPEDTNIVQLMRFAHIMELEEIIIDV